VLWSRSESLYRTVPRTNEEETGRRREGKEGELLEAGFCW